MWVILALLLFSPVFSFPPTSFEKSLTFQVDISCSIPSAWCANITFYTANYTNAAPNSYFVRDITFLKGTFCENSETATPIFPNAMVPFRNPLGSYVSYQIEHTCSGDGQLECVDVPHASYVPHDESFVKLFQHFIGTEKGNGKCKD